MIIKTSDGFELDADFQQIESSSKCVVFAHGITVDKDKEGVFVRSSKILNQEGISTLRFSFRGHGKSSGVSQDDFTISGQLIDLGTVISYVNNHGLNVVGLAGASFGGGASSLYVGLHPDQVKALFLVNPVLDYSQAFLNPTTPWAKKHFSNMKARVKEEGLIKVGSRQFAIGNKLVDEMDVYKPMNELEKFQGPILTVQGSVDTKIACSDVVANVEKLSNADKEMKVIEGSEHGFENEPYETQVTSMIVEFFVENL